MSPGNDPVDVLEGEAVSVERITAFKDGFAALKGFSDIALPIASIVKTSQGFSFSMSFRISFESAR